MLWIAVPSSPVLCSYCHAQGVVHGHVPLRRVAVETVRNRHICRQVDFSMAAHVPFSSARETLCGSLPCVAPEAALNDTYFPEPADCWSLGMLLLETACGQCSLKLSVQWCRGKSLAYARAGVHAAHILCAGFLRQVSAPIAFQARSVPTRPDAYI
ncbi:unnamed protein product [Prorocentrum cordatum]|uniref:Protein kinase domain-containing protein n=1 Tax=Prorocentrum cordatum TaxID=2364126 RepID=A0ABN9VNU3_9DINO|nr:unnamed protein product [Polarella glacialis]